MAFNFTIAQIIHGKSLNKGNFNRTKQQKYNIPYPESKIIRFILLELFCRNTSASAILGVFESHYMQRKYAITKPFKSRIKSI